MSENSSPKTPSPTKRNSLKNAGAATQILTRSRSKEMSVQEKNNNGKRARNKTPKKEQRQDKQQKESKESKLQSHDNEEKITDELLYYKIATTERLPGKRKIKLVDYVFENKNESDNEPDEEFKPDTDNEDDDSLSETDERIETNINIEHKPKQTKRKRQKN